MAVDPPISDTNESIAVKNPETKDWSKSSFLFGNDISGSPDSCSIMIRFLYIPLYLGVDSDIWSPLINSLTSTILYMLYVVGL